MLAFSRTLLKTQIFRIRQLKAKKQSAQRLHYMAWSELVSLLSSISSFNLSASLKKGGNSHHGSGFATWERLFIPFHDLVFGLSGCLKELYALSKLVSESCHSSFRCSRLSRSNKRLTFVLYSVSFGPNS